MQNEPEETPVPPKLLIWDWNGTIIDDTQLCLTLENELLRERGKPEITREWYLDNFTFPVRAYYERMGYTFETERFETVADDFMHRYRERYAGCPLREGVISVLEKAKRCGTKQTLLSVTQQDDLLIQASRFGVAPFFSAILGQSDSLCRSKTERAKAYMAQNGIAPDDALFIGDTDHDAEVARAVGCRCALIENGHQSRRVLEACGVPVYADCEALQRALFD